MFTFQKRIIIVIMMIFVAAIIRAQVTSYPYVQSKNNNCIITKVELTSTETIITIQVPKTGWLSSVSISSATVLVPSDAAWTISDARKSSLVYPPVPSAEYASLYAAAVNRVRTGREQMSELGWLIRRLGNGDQLDQPYTIKSTYGYFELHFDRLPYGVENVFIREVHDSGWEWVGVRINNPYPSVENTYLSEVDIKKMIDAEDDGITGIYEGVSGNKYKLGCIRTNDTYKLIYLGSGENISHWKIGEVKAILKPTATLGLYKADWNMANKTVESNTYVTFDGSMMKTVIDNTETDTYIKMYPTGESNHTSRTNQWSGTGIAIAPEYIVTNYHVVENAKTLVITGLNGNTNKNYDVEVVATDKFNDLAILKIIDTSFIGFPPFKYGFSTTIKDIGTDIFVLGYPLISTMGEEIKLTNGIISAKSGFQGDVSLYQISAPIQPGNSGGPLFDNNGDLIGIVSAKHKNAENVGYAIKLSYLKNLIESTDLNISLTSSNSIKSLHLKDKVKSISPMVVMIKANVSTSANYNNADNTSPTDPKISSPKESNQNINNNDVQVKEIYEKAIEAIQNGDNKKAYPYLKQLNEIHKTEEGMLLLGYVAASLGDTKIAIEAYDYCYEKGHKIEYVSLELGHLYSEIDSEKAIEYFTKCISINSRNIDAYFSRALLKAKNDRLEAIKDYKQVIKYDGLVEDNFKNRYHIATSYNNIAYGYLCLGVTDSRVNENISAALDHIKFMDFIWDTDGEYAYKIGDYERCINSMNNAIAIAKSNKSKDRANSYLYRGLAYLQLGDSLHAYRDLEIAMEQNDSLARVEIKRINVSSIDFSMEPESKIIKKPTISKNKSTYLTLEAIEQTDDCTILYFTSETTRYPSYSIDEHTYIRDNNTGIKYPLIATENCGISRVQMSTPYRDGKTRFQLYFPKLPAETKTIDFIEPGDSDWKIYGIRLK